MPNISIWCRYEGDKPVVIDTATSQRDAEYVAHNYALAIGSLPGQHRFRKDKVWAGRRVDEPPFPPPFYG